MFTEIWQEFRGHHFHQTFVETCMQMCFLAATCCSRIFHERCSADYAQDSYTLVPIFVMNLTISLT